ncbi:MAG: ATP-dependent 6-phosphofructokinase [Rickettsiales bacterium]|jgi:6-phosphofructokinase 1|nr:ATP-dependent 6-phosphofructokinase [Rickettsiales bacterium]
MAGKKKRVGVFTSGGDCAGLNMAVMAVVKRAITGYGWEIIGIEDGQDGLTGASSNFRMGLKMPFGDLIRQGGSFLGAFSRANYKDKYVGELETRRMITADVAKGIKRLKLDAIIATGGNGTMLFASGFARAAGVAFMGIPKTIDNDTPGSDISIGCNSAVGVCTDALDNIYWTAKSHRRAIVTEVMGRDTGHLALAAGVSSNADAILVPEIPYTIDGVVKKLKSVRKTEGREHFLIVAAEGAGAEKGEKLDAQHYGNVAKYVELKLDKAGFTVRSNQLGHIQRGSLPSAFDRQLASMLSTFAVDTLASGRHKCAMVGMRDGKFVVNDLSHFDKAATRFLSTKSKIVRTACDLGIYIGEHK